MTKTKQQNKQDLLILDQCSTVLPEEIKNTKALLNAKIVRTTSEVIGLTQTTQDSEIVKKAIDLYDTNEYRTITILTADRGHDGDTTFQTAYKNIGIISVKNKNINKIKSIIRDFSSVSGYLVKIDPRKMIKKKYKKFDKTSTIHIKKIK